ncbi:MAG: Smr/MutS family protein [Clostridia bacterium]|nr:Smr/MutS family protein [Clostridia bacterium]
MCDWINLEENYPAADEALDMLKNRVQVSRTLKTKILVIVHGYGSSGAGGKIKNKVRSWLLAQEKNHKIKMVIFGEDFNLMNEQARQINEKYKYLHEYYGKYNHGMTLVVL